MNEEKKGIAMTEKESLEKALVLWKKIAEKGYEYKAQAYRELGLFADIHDCPACQFAVEASYGPGANKYDFFFECCRNCPIWEWQERGFMCEKPGSSYFSWWSTKAPENAQKMVELVERILAGGLKEEIKESPNDQD